MRPAPAAGLAVGLLLAGLLVSRPLVLHLTDALPAFPRSPEAVETVLTMMPADTLQLYYQLWLLQDGVLGPAPFVRDPYQFRLDGPRWNLPQTFPALGLPFLLLSPLGPHVAYNLLVLLSFPLAGLAAYGLVRHYTGSTLAALAAGVGYALVPARVGPLLGGHPAGFAFGLAPLVLWGLDLALTRASLRGGLGGGVALCALATLEPHHAYLVGGLVPLYAGLRWATAPARPSRIPWLPVSAFLAGGAAGAAWLWMLRQAFLVGSIAERGRSLGEVRLYSWGPRGLLQPEPWGSWALLALAVAGLAWGARSARALRLGYGAMLLVVAVLGTGPTLPGFPLYDLLHRRLPLFALIRNPTKLWLLSSLAATVLAGYGVARLAPRRWTVAGGLAAAGLLLAVAAGTSRWPGAVLTRIPDSPVFAALRDTGQRALYLPLWRGDSHWSSIHLYAVTRTRVPMLNGYSPLTPARYPAEVVAPFHKLNVGDLGPAELSRLRQLGVSHLVLNRALFPPEVSPFPSAFTLARLRASSALRLERADDPWWLFRVVPDAVPAAAPPTSPVGVFFEAEGLRQETGRREPDAAASGGRVVIARQGTDRPGFLTFGPYRPLPAAAYRATFRVRGQGLVCEVTADNGRQVLAEHRVDAAPEWRDVTLAVRVPEGGPLEFRVRWDGSGDAAVDWVALAFADRPEPEWRFEVEDLPHKLGERPDPQASGGVAGYADPRATALTDVVSGPHRLYPAGRYRLSLWARPAAPAAGPLLRLAVSEPAGRLLASRVVAGAELTPDGYREVGLDFELARPTVLEFPIGYTGGTGVSFDRLAVGPR